MISTEQIICLSNSLKINERCVAGIALTTGKWVRPVSALYPENGSVPQSVRLIEGKEPELLDILEIPLDKVGQDFGFACENLTILDGEWKILGKVNPSDLIKYCTNSSTVLHNSSKYVNPSYLQSLPLHERHTLQLVQTNCFSVVKNNGWRGTISSGHSLTNAKITDPVFIEKLETGYQPTGSCLLTVSLSMPYAPCQDWEGESPCWKLIAGVIEF